MLYIIYPLRDSTQYTQADPFSQPKQQRNTNNKNTIIGQLTSYTQRLIIAVISK